MRELNAETSSTASAATQQPRQLGPRKRLRKRLVSAVRGSGVRGRLMQRRFALMIDLDGVLAHYDRKNKVKNIGSPLPGAVETVRALSKRFKIVIFSSRKESKTRAWLTAHGIPYDSYVEKPLNFLIIDDRALQFKGDWRQTLKQISRFRPWHERK